MVITKVSKSRSDLQTIGVNPGKNLGCPLSPLSLLLPSHFLLLPPFRSSPPLIELGGWGSTVSSPSEAWGEELDEIKFGAF